MGKFALPVSLSIEYNDTRNEGKKKKKIDDVNDQNNNSRRHTHASTRFTIVNTQQNENEVSSPSKHVLFRLIVSIRLFSSSRPSEFTLFLVECFYTYLFSPSLSVSIELLVSLLLSSSFSLPRFLSPSV